MLPLRVMLLLIRFTPYAFSAYDAAIAAALMRLRHCCCHDDVDAMLCRHADGRLPPLRYLIRAVADMRTMRMLIRHITATPCRYGAPCCRLLLCLCHAADMPLRR